MKKWIKLETDLLADARIRQLIQEHGMKGFGVYCMLRLLTDHNDSCSMDCLQHVGGEYTSRNFIDHVIQDFGLFDVNDHDVSLACTHTCTREPVREPVRESVREQVPLDKEENRIEEKENKESEDASAAFSSPEKEDEPDKVSEANKANEAESEPDDNPLEAMVQKLAQDRIWREALLITHPAERAMLDKDFDWCVRYALQCSLSEGREQRLYYPYMAKKFFNAFLGQPECVNRLRNAFICHEQPMEDRLTFDRLTQYYPRIMALPEPLTKAQLDSLIERWGTDQIVFTMRQLNNYANIDRYHGAMEAIERWAKKVKSEK